MGEWQIRLSDSVFHMGELIYVEADKWDNVDFWHSVLGHQCWGISRKSGYMSGYYNNISLIKIIKNNRIVHP